MAQVSVNDSFSVVTTSGDKGSVQINSHADLTLNNPARKSSGRALVASGSNNGQLVLNWGQDFPGGVSIQGKVNLANLGPPPAGVETDRVVVDANGNLYKVD